MPAPWVPLRLTFHASLPCSPPPQPHRPSCSSMNLPKSIPASGCGASWSGLPFLFRSHPRGFRYPHIHRSIRSPPHTRSSCLPLLPFLLPGAGPPGLLFIPVSPQRLPLPPYSLQHPLSSAYTLLLLTFTYSRHRSVTVYIHLVCQRHGPFVVFIEVISLLLPFHVLLSWPRGTWDLSPQPGPEPASPALEGEVLAAGTLEKPYHIISFYFLYSVLFEFSLSIRMDIYEIWK